MQHRGIVLAALGMLVLCILTLSVVSMPGGRTGPATSPGDSLTLKTVAPETPPPISAPVTSAPVFPVEPPPSQGNVVTGPDGCVLLGTPCKLGFLEDRNLVLMTNRCGVYAFDAASGGLAWYRYLESETGRQNASFGRRLVVVWIDDEVLLLDAATGRETWSQHNAPYGVPKSARLSPDETSIVVSGDQGIVLYSIAGGERRLLSRSDKAWVWGWLPDGKSLLLTQVSGNGPDFTRKWQVVDIPSGAATAEWESPKPEGVISMLSEQGQLAMVYDDAEKQTKLKILDARTGNVVHESNAPESIKYLTWTHDGGQLVSLSDDSREATVVDSSTGAAVFSLSQEGHRFSSLGRFDDSLDREWMFSQDASNNWYVWPLKAGGTPRMVLNSHGIAPGMYDLRNAGQDYILLEWRLEGSLWVHAAFSLPDMRKLAEWHIRKEGARYSTFLINSNKTHLVRPYPIGKPTPGPVNLTDKAFAVYVQDKETPIFEGQGDPIGISPDGKHLFAHTVENEASLFNLETGQAVAKYAARNEGNGSPYFTAAFSEDGRRVLVQSSRYGEITELVEGYSRHALNTEGTGIAWLPLLSRDGSRALYGGSGCAYLFDADTGAQLRTFVEPERFTRSHGGRGFWGGLVARAGDYAGAVTDRFKSRPYVEAVFANDGARVITRAENQVIRIWESDSGKLLHTIRTGLSLQRDSEGRIANETIVSPNGRFAFCFNRSGYGLASLWSLEDGTLVRQYRLPSWGRHWVETRLPDDGSGVYIGYYDNLYRWPGVVSGN